MASADFAFQAALMTLMMDIPLRTRVIAAWNNDLHKVQVQTLPEWLQEEWRVLEDAAHSDRPGRQGIVTSSFEVMSDEEVQDHARRLGEIGMKVIREFERTGKSGVGVGF